MTLVKVNYQEYDEEKGWQLLIIENSCHLGKIMVFAFVTRFYNFILMNEDNRCRPIVIHYEGEEEDDQVVLLMG